MRRETERPTVIVVPGWNQPSADLRTLAFGRNGIDGLAAHGFDVVPFDDEQHLSLDHRITRLAAFLEHLRRNEPWRFPVATLGFSVGALVVRGLLRFDPAFCEQIALTVQLAPPNWGVEFGMLPLLASAIRLPARAMWDMDHKSGFLRRLNGTSGHWTGSLLRRRWELDGEPQIAPERARILAVTGSVERFHGGDGIISHGCATLGDRIPAVTIEDPDANHLNLAGVANVFGTVLRGFASNDRMWPRVVEIVADALDDAFATAAPAPREPALR